MKQDLLKSKTKILSIEYYNGIYLELDEEKDITQKIVINFEGNVSLEIVGQAIWRT